MRAGEIRALARAGRHRARRLRARPVLRSRRAGTVHHAGAGLQLPGSRLQRERHRHRPRARRRPPLPLRGRARPAAPARHVRRGAPARDHARLSRQGDAASGDLPGAPGRRAVRLHAGGGRCPSPRRSERACPTPTRSGSPRWTRCSRCLERVGLVVRWQDDCSRSHRAVAESLIDAFAADATDIAAQIGRRALDELLAAHRLWSDWLREGRVRKIALVAEKTETPRTTVAGVAVGAFRPELRPG